MNEGEGVTAAATEDPPSPEPKPDPPGKASEGPEPPIAGMGPPPPGLEAQKPPRERFRPRDVPVPGDPAEKPRRHNEGPPGGYKQPKLRVRRFGMNAAGRYVYNDIRNLPPLEMDEDGYAMRPPGVSLRRRRRWTEEERKVRFLLMWNYSGGNRTLSCQEAGITRKVHEEWSKDEMFASKVREMEEEILDRLLLRLAMRVGLVRQPEGVKVHDAALFGMVKKHRPDLFEELPGGKPAPPAVPDIPRPPR